MSEFTHERASPSSDGLMTSRISTSLCRVIFESPEVHDAALLMTVLQADLTVLADLGYPGASLPLFVFLKWLTRLLFTNQSTGFYDRKRCAKRLGQRLLRKRVCQSQAHQKRRCKRHRRKSQPRNRRYPHLRRRYQTPQPHHHRQLPEILVLSKHQNPHSDLDVTDPRTIQMPPSPPADSPSQKRRHSAPINVCSTTAEHKYTRTGVLVAKTRADKR